MRTTQVEMQAALARQRAGKGNGAGLAATLLLHGAVIGGIALVHHRSQAEPLEIPRDFVVAELVKLGKPRDKFWLPRIPQPPRPKAPPPAVKLTDDPNAAPAPQEAPRPEDPEVSKDVRRALERARMLAKTASAEEPAEGLPAGVAEGTASEATAGDAYATAIAAAIRKHWSVPAELVPDKDLAGLEATVRIRIGEDGAVSDGSLLKPSGNGYYDDACLQAVKATGKVPPPPPELLRRAARGFAIVFAGKDVGR